MNVLVITGDKNFKPGNARFDLQASVVECLDVLYWGGGALWASPRGDSYDVVSTQDPFFRGLLGLFWARRFRATLNVQVHADLNRQSLLKRQLARFVLRQADTVRVVSERIKRQVEALGVRAPITVLPVFLDVESYKNTIRNPAPFPMILWIGRFEDEKDPLLAIEVFKEVLKKIPNARLTMVGDGSSRQELSHRAANLPIHVPVEFPGWKQDIVPFLARAHVVLSTSRTESWGASMVEALAARVPVVAPDVGIAKEAGATVVPREQLADAVVAVLTKTPLDDATLRLPLLSREAWRQAWKQSLE